MDKITSGEYLKFNKYYASFLENSISDYTIKLYLINSSEKHIFTADTTNGYAEFEIDTTDTAAISVGKYQYSYVAIDNSTSDITEIEKGYVEVTANIYTLATSDIRTHARVALDAIEAVLENRATVDQQSYSINNRQLVRMTIKDLLYFRDYYKGEVAREEAELSGKQNNKIKIRFA